MLSTTSRGSGSPGAVEDSFGFQCHFPTNSGESARAAVAAPETASASTAAIKRFGIGHLLGRRRRAAETFGPDEAIIGRPGPASPRPGSIPGKTRVQGRHVE